MKVATFAPKGGAARLGLVSRDVSSVLDVKAAATALLGRGKHPEFADMLALIDSGDAGLTKLNDLGERAAAREKDWHPLTEITLLAPLPEPRQIRDFAGFHDHLFDGAQGLLKIRARELGEGEPPRPSRLNEAIEKYPLFYIGNRLNVAGHDSHVAWPDYVNLFDFELEIGACIGRTGKDISRDQAESYIFGYTIFNDVSARDLQSRQMPGGMGPCKAKSHDGCNVLGPWIVTRDELPTPYGRAARVRVNGETWVETTAKAADVLHDFAEMIEFTSKGETIFAGEIFGSGTVSGCCGLEMDRWIKKGDVVELDFEGIGILRNRYG